MNIVEHVGFTEAIFKAISKQLAHLRGREQAQAQPSVYIGSRLMIRHGLY